MFVNDINGLCFFVIGFDSYMSLIFKLVLNIFNLNVFASQFFSILQHKSASKDFNIHQQLQVAHRNQLNFDKSVTDATASYFHATAVLFDCQIGYVNRCNHRAVLCGELEILYFHSRRFAEKLIE